VGIISNEDVICICHLGLTQKAALPLFECFAEQNLPQTRQKPYEYICLKSKCTNIIKKLKKASVRFLTVLVKNCADYFLEIRRYACNFKEIDFLSFSYLLDAVCAA
jgi:hypothetical protein